VLSAVAQIDEFLYCSARSTCFGAGERVLLFDSLYFYVKNGDISEHSFIGQQKIIFFLFGETTQDLSLLEL